MVNVSGRIGEALVSSPACSDTSFLFMSGRCRGIVGMEGNGMGLSRSGAGVGGNGVCSEVGYGVVEKVVILNPELGMDIWG